MKGLIAAAGLSARLQDLSEQRNKVLLDLGGESLLGTILTSFERADIRETFVVVGHDAFAVQDHCRQRANCLLNPFYEHYGILGSLWLAGPHLKGVPFTFTTGDHYFAWPHLHAFLQDQPEADVLVDVELKTCDDEDMKVYMDRGGQFRTMTKNFRKHGMILGEFTGLARFSADGSAQLFETLEKHVWQRGIQGYLADVLCAQHRKWPLAFHLSDDHHRVEVDFPCDLVKARQLYCSQQSPRKTG
ncbi:MAG TPA: NTP transferase domain-containing protein [Gemmataceae bacterium]|nr:NTP transferase domain-containing protein [Gemmataceae bacterium]